MPSAYTPTGLAVCEHCDQACQVPALARGQVARCPRCQFELLRHGRWGASEMLAVCITAIVAFVLANLYPLITLEVQGMTRHASLLGAIGVTWHQPGLWGVALMSLLTAFMLPLVQLLLLLALLLMVQGRRLPAGFVWATHCLKWFRPWSMVPVFVLGVLVAVIKIAALAKIIIGVGLWAMAALVVLLTILHRLDARTIWRYAELRGITQTSLGASKQMAQPQALLGCELCGFVHQHSGPATAVSCRCPRCNTVVHARKPNSLARTWAYLVTALLLYVPANVLPIMRTTSVFSVSEHTILGGVVELWRGGAPDIALVVFVASIAVPLLKFGALIVLLLAARQAQLGRLHSSSSQRSLIQDQQLRTKLYRFIEFIGQWSMLDVFVVLLLAALVNFQGLMQVTAGLGAIAFGLTVSLTMLSAMSFDPRLIWDGIADPHGKPVANPVVATSRAATVPAAAEPGEFHA